MWGVRLQLLTQHRQKHPCAVVDQRGDKQRAEQRKGVGCARCKHKERLCQQVDDKRCIVVEPCLINRGANAGEYAVCKVGLQPHLQVVVGRIVPEIQALAAHHGVQVEGGAQRDADCQNDGIRFCQPCAHGPDRAAVQAECPQHRRAGEQQQPDIHGVSPAAKHVDALQGRDEMRGCAEYELDCKNAQQKQDGPLSPGHPAIDALKTGVEVAL